MREDLAINYNPNVLRLDCIHNTHINLSIGLVNFPIDFNDIEN